jgi:hypothetical protein
MVVFDDVRVDSVHLEEEAELLIGKGEGLTGEIAIRDDADALEEICNLESEGRERATVRADTVSVFGTTAILALPGHGLRLFRFGDDGGSFRDGGDVRNPGFSESAPDCVGWVHDRTDKKDVFIRDTERSCDKLHGSRDIRENNEPELRGFVTNARFVLHEDLL